MLTRNGMVVQSLAIASIAGFASSVATAGINVSNGGARFTTQSSDAGASPVYVASFDQAMIFDPPSPGDFTTAYVIFPGGSGGALINNGIGNYFRQESAIDESFESVFQPTGTYTFAVQGGTLGDGSVSFVQPSISFPSILSLTNHSSLLAANPAADFVGGLSAFTIDPSWSLARTYIQLTNQTAGLGAFAVLLDASETSFTIPAGTLNPGDTYQLRLQAESFNFFETFDASGSLVEAGAYTSRVSITDITFTAIPAPGCAALLGLAGLAIRRRR